MALREKRATRIGSRLAATAPAMLSRRQCLCDVAGLVVADCSISQLPVGVLVVASCASPESVVCLAEETCSFFLVFWSDGFNAFLAQVLN